MELKCGNYVVDNEQKCDMIQNLSNVNPTSQTSPPNTSPCQINYNIMIVKQFDIFVRETLEFKIKAVILKTFSYSVIVDNI